MRVKSRVKKQWRSGSAHLAPSSTVGRLGSAGVKCAWERNHKKEEKGQKEGDPERERGVLISLRCCRNSVPSAPSSTCRTVRSVKPAKEFSINLQHGAFSNQDLRVFRRSVRMGAAEWTEVKRRRTSSAPLVNRQF